MRIIDIDIHGHHQQYAPDNPMAIQKLDYLLAPTTSEYSLCRCNTCGLEFAQPLRAPNVAWYEEAYRLHDLFPSYRWEFETVARELTVDDIVLEVGCGPGVFLECCSAKGVMARGLDLSSDAVSMCQQKGLAAKVHDLSESLCDNVTESPTVIAAFHVVEHLDNPVRFFQDSRKIARRGGRLFVSVPSDRRPSRLFGQRDSMDEPPHHMSRWSKNAFDAIGKHTGWQLKRLLYEPIGLRAAIWNISVASRAYSWCKRRQIISTRTTERAIRFLQLPYCLTRALTVYRNISGFSMLATFVAKG